MTTKREAAALLRRRKLKPVDRAYIAGFFDGEGCVHFRSVGKYNRPILSMSQKDPEVLHRIQDVLGYGKMSHNSANNQWQLRISVQYQIRHFIREVHRYSIVKRKPLRRARDNLTKRR
jgi:intein/homing endonuclease